MDSDTDSGNRSILPDWLQDIDALFDRLYLSDLDLGVEHYAKVLILMNHLQDKGIKLNNLDDVLNWVAPIICNNQSQKSNLERILDEIQRASGDSQPEIDKPITTAPDKANKQAKYRKIALVTLVIGAVLGFAAYLVMNSSPENYSGLGAVVAKGKDLNATYNGYWTIPLLLLLGGYILFDFFKRPHSQILNVIRTRSAKKKYIQIDAQYRFDEQSFYTAGESKQLIHALRQHVEVPSNVVDVKKSIKRTIESGGRIQVCNTDQLWSPEYLILLHKNTDKDHIDILAKSLINQFEEENLEIRTLTYQLDPQYSVDEKGNHVGFERFSLGANQSRLIVISNAEDFFLDGTLELKFWVKLALRWRWIALLTPKASGDWGKYENQLMELGLLVNTLSRSGMDNLARQMQHNKQSAFIQDDKKAGLWYLLNAESDSWLQSHEPSDDLVTTLMKRLSAELPASVFHCLCCVAVLPTINPVQTSYFIRQLNRIEFLFRDGFNAEDVICYLTRLPWFKEGYLPDWLRSRLIDAIPVTIQKQVRNICVEIVSEKLESEHSNSTQKVLVAKTTLISKLNLWDKSSGGQEADYLFVDFISSRKKLALNMDESSKFGQLVLNTLNSKNWLTPTAYVLFIPLALVVFAGIFFSDSFLREIYSITGATNFDLTIGIDLFLSSCILLPYCYRRFNSWPEGKFAHEGKPKDYLSDREFYMYFGLYVSTYLVMAFVLSQVPLLNNEIMSILESDNGLLPAFDKLFSENILLGYCLILIGLTSTVSPIRNSDERWRSFLHASAKIPRGVYELKLMILNSKTSFNPDKFSLSHALAEMNTQANKEFWSKIASETSSLNLYSEASLLLKCKYVVSIIQEFDQRFSLLGDIRRMNSRLDEIACVIPSINSDPIVSQEYHRELDRILEWLVEVLARFLIKTYISNDDRLNFLARHGIIVQLSSNSEKLQTRNISNALVPIFLGTTFISIISCTLSLLMFDFVNLPVVPDYRWFTLDRVTEWSFRNAICFCIAIAVGVYFYFSLDRNIKGGYYVNGILAFIASSTSISVFFAISMDAFQAPLLWVIAKYSLMSTLVIFFLRRRVFIDIRKESLKAASFFALASGILQALSHLAVQLGLYPDVNATELDSVAMFFMFGLLNGFLIAFWVSYRILNFSEKEVNAASRKSPRLAIEDTIEVTIEGVTYEAFVENLSKRGARLSTNSKIPITIGGVIVLQFGFGEIKGHIVSVQKGRIRVVFDCDDSSQSLLDSYIDREFDRTLSDASG